MEQSQAHLLPWKSPKPSKYYRSTLIQGGFSRFGRRYSISLDWLMNDSAPIMNAQRNGLIG